MEQQVQRMQQQMRTMMENTRKLAKGERGSETTVCEPHGEGSRHIISRNDGHAAPMSVMAAKVEWANQVPASLEDVPGLGKLGVFGNSHTGSTTAEIKSIPDQSPPAKCSSNGEIESAVGEVKRHDSEREE